MLATILIGAVGLFLLGSGLVFAWSAVWHQQERRNPSHVVVTVIYAVINIGAGAALMAAAIERGQCGS